jgi:hypothetical protein
MSWTRRVSAVKELPALLEAPVLEAVREEVTREPIEKTIPNVPGRQQDDPHESRRFDGGSGPRPTAISSTFDHTRRIGYETDVAAQLLAQTLTARPGGRSKLAVGAFERCVSGYGKATAAADRGFLFAGKNLEDA